MPGLVPGIHVLRASWSFVDGRDRPGHDVRGGPNASTLQPVREPSGPTDSRPTCKHPRVTTAQGG
ncbi:MAG: hypothetical protein EKK33_36255 [Bradyrhizobiaceae bacterium]|nr:MAG: hypothetical protein EKK33_36255 [Bradyrhizobiaceae bacterium]